VLSKFLFHCKIRIYGSSFCNFPLLTPHDETSKLMGGTIGWFNRSLANRNS
jgi:hypothetical protein